MDVLQCETQDSTIEHSQSTPRCGARLKCECEGAEVLPGRSAAGVARSQLHEVDPTARRSIEVKHGFVKLRCFGDGTLMKRWLHEAQKAKRIKSFKNKKAKSAATRFHAHMSEICFPFLGTIESIHPISDNLQTPSPKKRHCGRHRNRSPVFLNWS